MERRFGLLLWATIAAGVALATAMALATGGDPYDMESFRLVRDVLNVAPLDVYDVFAERGTIRWPYPPAFFPWIYGAGRLDGPGPIDFEFLLRLAPIAATACIAWFVQDFLGERGAPARTRLASAALVSLGPSFLVIAGYHGQIDSVAILPAVIALSRWEFGPASSRALTAGLLIGLGGAVKTVPLLLILALLPSARSRREGLTLLIAACVPVAAAFLPYALAGGLPQLETLTYRGLPGVGGLSLVVQPELPLGLFGTRQVDTSGLSDLLAEHGRYFVAAVVLAVAGVGLNSRASAPAMAVLLWLAVLALGVNFFFQYVIWGLPFFLMAGYVRGVLAVQVALLAPTLIFYLRPYDSAVLPVTYSAMMIAIWGATVITLASRTRHLLNTRLREEPVAP